MARKVYDRVKEYTASTGIGGISFIGAFTGFQSFDSVFTSGDTTFYVVEEHNQWEVGVGTYGSNNLERDTVLSSSNGGSKINLTGSGVVSVTLPASQAFFNDDAVYISGVANYASGQAIINEVDIVAVSGWADSTFLKINDNTYVSGVATYASGQAISNESNLIANSGYFESRVDSADENIVYISGIAVFASGHNLQSVTDNGSVTTNAITVNNNNITASSGLFDSLDMTPIAEANYPPHQEGVLFYDNENHTLSLYNEEADVTLQLGQEEFLRVRNNTGATIQNGTAVLINGAHGNAAPTISGAIANSESSSQVVGLATHSIEHNSFGYVTTHGIVRDIDTSSFSAGDEIFLSATQVGSGVNVSPVIPNYEVTIGHVIRSHSNGSVLVQVGHPKLGGGDLKSESVLNLSGVPFVSQIADTTAGGSLTDSLFVFDSGNRQLQLGSGVQLLSGEPSNTTNVLYNDGGDLYFNGSEIGVSGESLDFAGNILTYNNSKGGSFTADLSSLSTFDTSGVSLGYSAGTLTYTNNAGGTFDVDLSSISGDVYAMIVDGAPSTLDTLNEIAAALNDDSNIANTLTTLITSTSGNLQSQITENVTDISSASGYFESRADSLDSDMAGVSGQLYGNWTISDGANSENILSGETVSFSGVGGTTVSYDISSNLVSISGASGGGATYTAGSGLTLAVDEFNVYGGSGNFEYVELQTDNTTIPKLKFTGSGVTDTPITLEVRSSYESASESGSALLFQGSQGQLFSITDNLSSGVIFSVADIAGLPMLEVDASGHVQIGEFADDITIHQSVLLSGGVPASTTNKLYNDNGSLYFNGSSLGYNDASLSGYFESRADQDDVDLTYISGVAVYASGLDNYLLNPSGVGGISITSDVDTVVFSGDATLARTLDLNYVSGVAVYASGQITPALTAGSGITIDSANQINVHGGSGHFINLDVDGAFTATTKSFLIDHPSKEGMKLQYGSLEGPENGVYVRGTTNNRFITLPSYWRDLVNSSSITVSLTCLGSFQPLFVEQKNNREIIVGGVCGYYDYVVYGERKDVEKLQVEW